MHRSKKPLIPMGAITGNPTHDELQKNLENYRKAGIEQFLIYPRSGLEVEYMGPEWIDICRYIIEYCAEHDMHVWLYDEYNWPSGKCKGKVIKANPDFASKKLVAFADRNFCGLENPNAPAPEYFWTEMSIPIYADILDPDSVEHFIELTHEVYYSNFSKYFGSTIKGIFSDEPSFMYAKFQGINGSAIELPYYKYLKEDYRKNTGRDLINDLESYLKGVAPKDLWHEFYSILGKRFCNVYMGKIRDWCDAHNILFTGHLMHEPHPTYSIEASGRPVDAMRSFSMPGLDEIPSNSLFDNIEWNTFKLLESSMNGPRTEALAELFALGPSDMSLAKMREMIYISAVHGVNHFVTAVSALDARGNVEKSIYYNPIAPAQPWFKYISGLNDSAAEAAELTRKKSSATIALRYPQKLFSKKWNHKNPPDLKVDYTELIKALINAQWEFRIIGDDEKADEKYKVVFELNDEGTLEELSGAKFKDIPEMLAYLEKNQKRRASLHFADGKLVEKILLKSYDDGTVCAVNASTEYLRGVSIGKDLFDMPPRDVAILPGKPKANSKKVLDLKHMPMEADIEGTNSMRCIFPSAHEFTIEVKDDVKARFSLREYSGAAEVLLDGQKISASNQSHELPEGLKQLYRESDMFTLQRGTHQLRLVSDAKDLPYLPLAFLLGRFAKGKEDVIRSLPDGEFPVDSYFADNLMEFAGTAVFSLNNIDLSAYDGITFNYKNMVLELFANGKSLGPCLWEPFEWIIPQELRKSDVDLKLHVTSSIGPLFGNYPEHQPEEMKKSLNEWWPGIREL